MKLLILVSAVIALVASLPVEKWHRSSDGCPYYIENELKFNWYQAWEECLNKNMTLLALDSFYKHQQINGLVELYFPKKISVWLAGHDNAVEKRHVWAITGKVFSFTNWAKDQPNYAANDHCILIHDSTNQWHDFPCSTKLGFVCEQMQCSNARSAYVENGHWIHEKKYNVNVWSVFGNQNKD